jgi:hypothetical protein
MPNTLLPAYPAKIDTTRNAVIQDIEIPANAYSRCGYESSIISKGAALSACPPPPFGNRIWLGQSDVERKIPAAGVS